MLAYSLALGLLAPLIAGKRLLLVVVYRANQLTLYFSTGTVRKLSSNIFTSRLLTLFHCLSQYPPPFPLGRPVRMTPIETLSSF